MKPLILDFKTTRQESEMPTCYEYDPIESMNMIVVKGQKKPFIDSEAADIDLVTRTRVIAEKDDFSQLFELITRTKVSGEKDDKHIDYVELSTKTLVKTEKDDTRTSYH